MDQDHNAPPLNPLPPIVWLLVLPLIAVEVAIQLHTAGLIGSQHGGNWRTDLYYRFALVPELLHRQWAAAGSAGGRSCPDPCLSP